MAKVKKPRKRPLPMGRLALRESLAAKLTAEELRELERELRVTVEKACTEATEKVAENAYRQHWAIVMRVLVDRFGWGHVRIRRLWDACLEYIHDIDEGLLNTEEMLACLKNEDGIVIRWRVDI